MIWLLACTPEPEPRPPDVLLVVVDTVRADHLRAYGYERDTSYQIEALAQAGVLFEDVTVSGTWTTPGHASLFTGEPPWVHGAHYTNEDLAYPVAQLRPELPTLAERFSEQGYETAALVTNELALWGGLDRGFARTQDFERDHQTVAAVGALLAEPRERPLFLVVNLLSAHSPYTVAEGVPWSARHAEAIRALEGPLASMRHEHEGSLGLDPSQDCAPGLRCDVAYAAGAFELEASEQELLSDLYDGGLVRVDNALKAVIDAWIRKRQGVVAVTSDHGELLGEHHLLQHRFTALPELIHVPLVVVGPGLPAGARVSEPVQVMDIGGALLELAGFEQSGWNLLDAVAGTPRPEPIRAAAWPSPKVGEQAPVLSQPWLWYREGQQAVAVSGERVLAFPLGGRDIPAERLQALEAGARAIPLDEEARAAPLDEGMRAKLEALGYMD